MVLTVLASLFTWENILFLNIGLAAGIIVGALPGLTGTMCIALLLPMTYGLNSLTGMILLLGVYCGGIYGGSVTAILINTPGTPASAATVLDGYPMAKKGQAGRALGLALSASEIGGLFSVAVLIVAAPQIARVALDFGPAEYFALALFGLTIIASVGGSLLKGLIMGLVGLFVATIGMDPVGGTDRFTFNITELSSGVNIIPALIGLFAITEIMYKARDIYKPAGDVIEVKSNEKISFRDVLQYKATLLKSSIIGTFIGVVPGTGAAIASFLSYNEAKRASKHPELFGTGDGEGIVASEAANNAVTGGTLVPLLTLGLPGDTNTAVLLGALTMQGIIPGPQLFVQQRQWVYSIMFALIIVNIFMYIQGRFFIKFFVNVTKVPTQVLVPILITLCIIGAYAVNNTTFDALLMALIGLFGYYMKKLDFPLTPMVIAIVLGPLAESNMRRALIISQGSALIFFQKPISCFFILLAVFMLFFPMVKKHLEKKKGAAAA
ncbi:C4-dicarboxylate ABC transporter permease [Clostridium sp. W14A]|uniref:Tripartite tricarboxylate transporter permease n=1 Tax=Caproicibacter fermentans TaxID=2576756 RepID=A0A7G8T9S3_9FIRM|nr:C4-dicarboxylate ABC transporter permease [Clostridium sp. W14A]QNK40364.1 tripartite tricarboxylate transporter permease [Caproicibacter fermentans]